MNGVNKCTKVTNLSCVQSLRLCVFSAPVWVHWFCDAQSSALSLQSQPVLVVHLNNLLMYIFKQIPLNSKVAGSRLHLYLVAGWICVVASKICCCLLTQIWGLCSLLRLKKLYNFIKSIIYLGFALFCFCRSIKSFD